MAFFAAPGSYMTLLAGSTAVFMAFGATASPVSSSAVSPCVNNALHGTVYHTNSDAFNIECLTDIPGGDMGSVVASSFGDCIKACSTTSDCVGAAYKGDECYLKDTILPASWSSSVQSAILVSAKTGQSGLSCIDNQSNGTSYTASNLGVYTIYCATDFYGGDLSNLHTSSFADCINACDNTKSCTDISFVSGTCYLKNSQTTGVDSSSVWSANKASGSGSSKPISSSKTASSTPAGTSTTIVSTKSSSFVMVTVTSTMPSPSTFAHSQSSSTIPSKSSSSTSSSSVLPTTTATITSTTSSSSTSSSPVLPVTMTTVTSTKSSSIDMTTITSTSASSTVVTTMTWTNSPSIIPTTVTSTKSSSTEASSTYATFAIGSALPSLFNIYIHGTGTEADGSFLVVDSGAGDKTSFTHSQQEATKFAYNKHHHIIEYNPTAGLMAGLLSKMTASDAYSQLQFSELGTHHVSLARCITSSERISCNVGGLAYNFAVCDTDGFGSLWFGVKWISDKHPSGCHMADLFSVPTFR